MKLIENVSRPVRLKSAGGDSCKQLWSAARLYLSARFVPEPLWAAEGDAPAAPFEPSLWMSIAPDGTVTIVAHRSEMGCGSRTALPLSSPTNSTPTGRRSKLSRRLAIQIWRPGYGRLALRSQQLRFDAAGRRHRTRHVDQRSRSTVGRFS